GRATRRATRVRCAARGEARAGGRSWDLLTGAPAEAARNRAGRRARFAGALHFVDADRAVARRDDDAVVDREDRARRRAAVDGLDVGQLQTVAQKNAGPGIERAET